MSFEQLSSRLIATEFCPPRYEKTILSRPFFEFVAEDYNRKKDSAKVMEDRTDPTDGKLRHKINDEIKLAWMCGMERDRRVQMNHNYSTIYRNACLLRRAVESHLKHALVVLNKE